MLLRYFYDERLAQASYFIGCQKTKEALVIDPARNISPYTAFAEKEGFKISAAAETHIHADFVSGARELGRTADSKLYLSGEGPENWTYQNLEGLQTEFLHHGDIFHIGNIKFETVHTPGHTPESLSFILTDAGADEPMGLFTGDFVFVGDVGRPDLLEKAAGESGTAEAGAKDLYKSLEWFKSLPDYLQIWPGHGAGSACGKALGAVPSTTAGYEKRFNSALQSATEDDFVTAILEGQTAPPHYFSEMKRVNKEGAKPVSEIPEPEHLSPEKIKSLIEYGAQVLDIRSAGDFETAHAPGTYNIPYNKGFLNWAGWLVSYHEPLYLVLSHAEQLQEAAAAMQAIGLDDVRGYITAEELLADTAEPESYQTITPAEAEKLHQDENVAVLDVRNPDEWDRGHINDALHIKLGDLKEHLDQLPKAETLIVHCQSGVRSAMAASLLQAHGFKNILNMAGGYSRWEKENR